MKLETALDDLPRLEIPVVTATRTRVDQAIDESLQIALPELDQPDRDSALTGEMGLDSVQIMNLVMEIEDQLDILGPGGRAGRSPHSQSTGDPPDRFDGRVRFMSIFTKFDALAAARNGLIDQGPSRDRNTDRRGPFGHPRGDRRQGSHSRPVPTIISV